MEQSYSHWGMFIVPAPIFMVPQGFRIDPRDWAEMNKTAGIVRLIAQ